MDKGNTIGFGFGLLAGLIIGGVTAVLYTPKSGKDTRRIIVNKTTGAVDAVREKIDDAMDTVKEATTEVNRKRHGVVYAMKN